MAVVAIALGVVGMSAFEAHIINVTAQIENALAVSTNEIEFGTVFPQESFIERMDIRLSGSFLEEDRVDDISYILKQKSKPRPDVTEPTPSGEPIDEFCHNWLPEDFGDPGDPANPYYIFCYPSLCPYLSKHDADPEDQNDSPGVLALHDPGITILEGHLGKAEGDIIDLWDIDLVVPCFEEHCAQDWPAFVAANNPDADPEAFKLDPRLNSSVFGCDLWFEVTGFSFPQNTFCGDGIVQTPNDEGTGGPNNDGNEECDTSDPIPCVDQEGYDGERDCTDCTLGECIPTESCGDGTINGNEVCDDGANNGLPNFCNIDCTGFTQPECGNGTIEGNEECDDGTSNSDSQPDACRTDCTLPICGDSVVDSGEECDDGGTTPGDGCSAICEIEEGTITITKVVENNGVGTLSAGDFQMEIDGVDEDQNTAIPVGVGTRTVGEDSQPGYEMSFTDGDCDSVGEINVQAGQDYTCEVTNEFLVGTITVTKVVTNNHGGTAGIGDFNLFVDATAMTSGVSMNFAPGTYTVTESGVFGYEAIFSGDCDANSQQITIAAAENKTCTITNDDIRPVVNLEKSVINDNGGSALPTEFIMRVDGVPVPHLGSKPVNANTNIQITEDAKAGYSFFSLTGTNCPSALGQNFQLTPGQSVTCTVTNDDN